MATPTDHMYGPAAVPWPEDDDHHLPATQPWYSKPGLIAVLAVSLVALIASIAAVIFAVNLGQVTPGRNVVAPPSVPSTPSSSAATPPTQDEAQAREAERRRAEQAARLDPSTYTLLTQRDFALMAKNPDAWQGRKIIVYGVVTQFDAATGPSSFRANTAATPQADEYDYEQNTYITARAPGILANVVEDDWVTMYVEVEGSYTYDTQIGGSTTVPAMWVNIINPTTSDIGSAPTAGPVPSPPTATVTVPYPLPGEPESASLTQLRAIGSADRPVVANQLAERWVPQLSSKRSGLVAEGRTWDNAAILREHLQLRQTYPGARLLWSGDWSTFSEGDFWVTVAGVSFPDAAGALTWCTNHGFDRDHCYAKVVSTTHPIEGSTAYN